METQDTNKNEAEFAGFVDRGTQVVLQDAIKKIVETFSQNDAMEDILGYLEEMREVIQGSDDRIKEIQHKEKQINDRVAAVETSVKSLLQRLQSMEVKIAEAGQKVDAFAEKLDTLEALDYKLDRLVEFFSRPPFSRMFSKLENQEAQEEEDTTE